MNMNFKFARHLLSLQGRKLKATGSFKNGKRCYQVTGWSGEYTLEGIAWQLGA